MLAAASGGDIGDIFKAAAIAYVSAEAFSYVGHGMPLPKDPGLRYLAKAAAHGVVGGVRSVASGGKFKHGFLAAGVAQLGAPAIDGLKTVGGRVAAAAVVGGTASKLGGGKFANGAITAAFGRVYNEEHRKWVNPTGREMRECKSKGCGYFGASRGGRLHKGVDYKATPGQDILAVTDGKIGKIGFPYPNNRHHQYIQIDTSDGYQVREMYVAPAPGIVRGVEVSGGQVIGTYQGLQTLYPGITPHVHVEIRLGGKLLNPTTMIPLP